MDQAIGANLIVEGKKCVVATTYRPLAAPEFSDDDVERFRILLPHLQRAMHLRERFRSTDRYAAGIRTALEAFDKPAILLARKGRFLHANPPGEQLFADRSLHLSRSGLLEAAIPEETHRLRSLVDTAAALDARVRGGRMIVRREGRPALVLLVCALPRDSESGASAIVFVEDPESKASTASDAGLLRTQYGLTQAEADLALLLLEGGSLREAARKRGIAFATARTHLARTFEKTGVHGQPALMRLLLRSGHAH